MISLLRVLSLGVVMCVVARRIARIIRFVVSVPLRLVLSVISSVTILGSLPNIRNITVNMMVIRCIIIIITMIAITRQ